MPLKPETQEVAGRWRDRTTTARSGGREFQLRLLEKRTRGNPTDADGDIDFAYRNMALPSVTPLMALSVPPKANCVRNVLHDLPGNCAETLAVFVGL